MPTKHTEVECESCSGTGLYAGLCEGKGLAVICGSCKGTGHHTLAYKPFTVRHKRRGIKKVIRSSCGMILPSSNLNVGGVDYKTWLQFKSPTKFPPNSELRQYVCPTWFYQDADYKRKPEWEECISMGSFRDCKHFKTKHKCWKRFDEEKL